MLFGSETCVERSHSIFGTNRHKNRRTTDRNTTSADGMYFNRASMYGDHTHTAE